MRNQFWTPVHGQLISYCILTCIKVVLVKEGERKHWWKRQVSRFIGGWVEERNEKCGRMLFWVNSYGRRISWTSNIELPFQPVKTSSRWRFFTKMEIVCLPFPMRPLLVALHMPANVPGVTVLPRSLWCCAVWMFLGEVHAWPSINTCHATFVYERKLVTKEILVRVSERFLMKGIVNIVPLSFTACPSILKLYPSGRFTVWMLTSNNTTQK